MNKIFVNILVFVYRLCKKIRFKIVRILLQKKQKTNTPYVTLTPKKITIRNEYFNAMDFALSKNDVRNIAVTGSYGAGKSTIIRSYMEKFKPNEFINVSLAGFDMPETREQTKAQEVELSILQQILYKKNRDALPDSRIDRILNRNQAHIRRVFWSVLKVAAPLGGILALIYHHKVLEFTGVPVTLFSFINDIPYSKAVFLLIFFLAALYFITECASQVGIFDKKIKLNKVALLSGEMELGSTETSSLLNNCLDEIVYFFSRVDNYRLVVFEDLDRLKNPDIFIKLREINKIVNNNLSEDNPLRFIYAVRDDIFSGAEARTKFFDFIIPVVPVMDSRNAFSLLNDKMNAIIPGGEECLRSTSVYISDMRSLYNIINEYYIFSKAVDNKTRNISLYAMVFYKNMFSHDYSLIDKKVSIIYKFIHHFRTLKLHENYFGCLDARITSLRQELDEIREEKARTAEDIRKSIIYSFIPERLTEIVYLYWSNSPNYHHLSQSLQQADIQQLINDETSFEDLFGSSHKVSVGYYNQNYRQYQTITLSDPERISAFENYQRRKKIVGEERELNFKKTEKSLSEAREEKRRKNAISLADLVTLMKKDKFIDIAKQYMEEINKHDLLSAEQKKSVLIEMQYGGYDAIYLLLSRGYLDQDYMRSRSVFHKGGLSSSDNEFVKDVALGLSGQQANEEVAIDDVRGVIREIAAQRLLHQDAVMHYQIVAHMLEADDNQLDEMIATLFGRPGKYVLAILSILESRFADPESFPSLLKRALEKNEYLDRMLNHLEKTDSTGTYRTIGAEVVSLIAPQYSEDRALYRRYVELLGTGIVDLFRPERLDAFLTHILELKVCYDTLSDPLSANDKACLRFIGEKSLYRLTRHNVGIILAALLDEHEITPAECEQRPWSLAEDYHLNVMEYFEENADEFVREIFLSSAESEAAILTVLQLSTLSEAMKLSIVREMNFCLDTLTGIPEVPGYIENGNSLSFHDAFYSYDRIVASWPELMTYICEECDLQVLTDFVSRHASTLSRSGPEIEFGSDYELLYKKIICNTRLNEDDYKKIVKNISINTEYFDDDISDRLIIRLLNMDKIPLTRDDFTNVTKSMSALSTKISSDFAFWIGRHQDEMMSDPDYYLCKDEDFSVFESLLSQMMFSPDISDDNKAELFANFADYYHDGNAGDIKLPEKMKISFFSISDDKMKLRLMISLVSKGYRDRTKLAEMALTMEEKELSKIFIQKTAKILLNDRDNCQPLLDALVSSGMVKEYIFRDDGKVDLKMRVGISDPAE